MQKGKRCLHLFPFLALDIVVASARRAIRRRTVAGREGPCSAAAQRLLHRDNLHGGVAHLGEEAVDHRAV